MLPEFDESDPSLEELDAPESIVMTTDDDDPFEEFEDDTGWDDGLYEEDAIVGLDDDMTCATCNEPLDRFGLCPLCDDAL